MKDKWISVDDRLPELKFKEYSELILLYNGNFVTVGYYEKIYVDSQEMHFVDMFNLNTTVTHWQPLPNPPNNDK